MIVTDETTGIVLAAILDQNLGIIAACIPTFRPLFRSFTRTKTQTQGISGNTNYPSHYYSNISSNKAAPADAVGIRSLPRSTSISVGGKLPRTSTESDIPLQPVIEPKGITQERKFEVVYTDV